MAPRLPPLTSRNGSDRSSVPDAFLVNQTRPEGRSMRPVRENQAVAEMRAEIEKNQTKAAKAKATRDANLSRSNLSVTQAENRLPLPGGLLSTPMSQRGPVGTGQPMHQSFIYPAQPPQWVLNSQSAPSQVSDPPLNLLDELNNPNFVYHPGQTFEHPSQTNHDNFHGLSSGGNQNITERSQDGGSPWRQFNSVAPEAELEQDLSDDDSVRMGTGPGINIQSRDINLKNRKVREAKSSLQLEEVADADTSITENTVSNVTASGRASRSIQVLPYDIQRVVVAAHELLRKHLTKVNPWPDTAKHQQAAGIDEYSLLAIRLWDSACMKLEIEDMRGPTNIEKQRILDRTSNFRGQVRDKASDLVAHAYNFVNIQMVQVGAQLSSADEAQIKSANRVKYVAIKETFYYKHPEDVSIPNTMYHHPIIQHVLNTTWFGEGTYARSHHFTGEAELPLPTIAFILTAIENAIDAWRDGIFDRVDFSCKLYYQRYLEHLESLQDWKDFCAKEPHNLAADLQVSLLETARLSCRSKELARCSEDDKRESKRARLARFAVNQGPTGD